MGSFSVSRVYYGWKNMLGSFICAALVVGFTTYIFGLFLLPVTEEYAISRASYNNGMIGLMLGMVLMSPIVGSLVDKYSGRQVLIAGGIIFGGSLITLSQLNSLIMMLAVISIPLAFAFGACGMINANTLTVRWFLKRRGRALGILALSTSVGGFIAQPLTAFLIEIWGWRTALLIIGVVAAVIIVTAALLIVRDGPDGHESGYQLEFSQSSSDADVTGELFDKSEVQRGIPDPVGDRIWSKTELLRSRNFWITAVCIGLLFGIDQAVLVSQVSYFQDTGLTLSLAAILVSVKTISAIIGKLVIGYLADRVDLRWLFVYVAGCNALLMSIYILQPGFIGLVIAVALLGVAVGGVFPVWATLMAWLFGPKSYGTVMGLMSIITQPFAIIMLRFVGEMHDRTGSYVSAFSFFIAFAILAIGLIWLLKPEAQPEQQDKECGQSQRVAASG